MKQNRWLLSEDMFGPLYPYIIDEDITDIDWDGDSLWISSIKNGTKREEVEGVDAEFVEIFSHYVANSVGQEFNQVKQTLSAETDTLRITFAHDSLVTSGMCFSIRKSMPKLRFSITEALQNEYCDEEVINLLINCVKIKLNFAFCGEPGAGKTECAKFFSTFINEADKVITVEDTLEWHYKNINPGKRADEIKVNDASDYTQAIKLALRLNPSWLMLSEARSTEVQYLIEGWSTGVHGMTTLHTGSVRDIPDRITNMMNKGLDPERMENNVYSYLNVGVYIKREELPDGRIVRKIKEVGLFRHTEGGNECVLIMKNGIFNKSAVPQWFLELFMKNGIEDPYRNDDYKNRLEDERKGMFYGMNESSTERKPAISHNYNPENVNTEDIINIVESIQRG